MSALTSNMGQLESSQREILTQSPWPELGVFAGSMLVTLAFWIVFPAGFHHETSDYPRSYEPVAREILKGNGVANADGTPAILYPPAYPLLIASVFKAADMVGVSEPKMLSAMSLLCMGTASLFLFILAKSIWGLVPALMCSLIWMTYPFALWLTKNPNSEIPFMAVFSGALCLFWYSLIQKSRAWHVYFVSGLLMGVAMLIRPIAIGSGLVMAATLWLAAKWMTPRSRLLVIVVMLLGNLAAIFPWEAWVYSRTGRVIPLSSNGPVGLLDGLTFGVSMPDFEFRQGQRVELPLDVVALMERIKGRSGELESLGDFAALIGEELQASPVTVAKLFIIKAARSWYAIESHRFETLSILIHIPYFVLVLWSSKLAWQQGGIAQLFVMGIWMMVLYFWAMNMMASTLLRYMVPALGLLFLIVPAVFVRPHKVMS